MLRGQFALPNPTGTGKDGMNHYCHLPFTRNMETRPPEINSDWPAKSHHGGVFAVFSSLVGKIYFALATSSCWYCPNDSDVKAECLRTQAWVSHGVSCFWNHILAWNVTSLTSVGPFRYEQVSSGDHFLSVYFSHVYNSGLCASHLVNLLSLWLLRHGALIVHLKLTG